MSDTTSERQKRHCRRTFTTNRGFLQHLNFCRHRNGDLQKTVIKPEVRSNHSFDYEERHSDGDHERFSRNEVAGSRFEALIHDAYEKIIQWKRNTFMLPTGASGKKYIDETTRLFNLWINKSPCNASFITSKTEKIFKIERTSRSTNKTIITLEWRENCWTTIWKLNYTRSLESSWKHGKHL